MLTVVLSQRSSHPQSIAFTTYRSQMVALLLFFLYLLLFFPRVFEKSSSTKKISAFIPHDFFFFFFFLIVVGSEFNSAVDCFAERSHPKNDGSSCVSEFVDACIYIFMYIRIEREDREVYMRV